MRKGRTIIFAIILIICLLCTACTPSYTGIKQPLLGGQPDAEVIANGGRATQQGDWIYFINGDNFTRATERFQAYSGALCRMHTDGSDAAIIVNLDVSLFNIQGEYIYFASYENTQSYSCRVKIDGTDYKHLEQIDDIYNGGCYAYSDGYIYFTQGSKLFRMKGDGSEKQKLTDFQICNLRLGDKYAYFTEKLDDSNIGCAYKVAHNSADVEKITKSPAYILDVQGDTAYYYILDNGYVYSYNQDSGDAVSISFSSYEEYLFLKDQSIICASYVLNDSGMYILPINGGSRVKISDDSAERMAYWDGYIYYVNKSSLLQLYRIRPDGTGREMVSSDFISETDNLVIIDGWIYYFSDGDEGRIYRLQISDFKTECLEIEDIGIVGG